MMKICQICQILDCGSKPEDEKLKELRSHLEFSEIKNFHSIFRFSNPKNLQKINTKNFGNCL